MINELVALAKERYTAMHDFMERFESLETEEVANCECNPVRPAAVHINSGLQVLADECGATIKMESRGDGEYPWEHSFDYSGVRFFEITETKTLI